MRAESKKEPMVMKSVFTHHELIQLVTQEAVRRHGLAPKAASREGLCLGTSIVPVLNDDGSLDSIEFEMTEDMTGEELREWRNGRVVL